MGVEALLGFVEEQDAGRAEQHHREVEELLLARGQLVREALGEVVDLEGGEEVVRALVGGADVTTPRRVDEDEVVDDGEVAVCRRGAEERGHPRTRGRVALVQGATVQCCLTLRGLEGPGEDPQQRGLAAAVLPAQHEALPRGDGEVDRSQQDVPVDLLTDPGGAQRDRTGRLAPTRTVLRCGLRAGLLAACEHLPPSSPSVCHQPLEADGADVVAGD